MAENKEERRERLRALAAEFEARGDTLGWFDAFYKESAGDIDQIPWADLEPNSYFRTWAESSGLKGDGRKALVVGCGLGDDAKYLHDLGFKVTAFDISPTAIEWAKKLYGDAGIEFVTADLFAPPTQWIAEKNPPANAGGSDKKSGFDFVLEIYTIQPLPIEMRPDVIDAIAAFVAEKGSLVVVTRGREDDVEPDVLPWPMSRPDLSRFEKNGLTQTGFVIMPSNQEDEPPRFVVEYCR